ncbi:hypothetical protein PR202_gb11734 [Eleusine coracana subsp. coracana]|uniref:Protein DA1-like domain-containing protein n=1 Tax=Eleusine coracana subsp. coracana TaxID=191504 RepID=A0AAV5EKZ7_ELECO|nr:hypothetical protein PR202_gb11734 [Eleusine coracana subsp. coracana]
MPLLRFASMSRFGAHGSDDEDMDHAIALSLSEEDQRKKGKAVDTEHHLDEDEQLARALQESMNDGPPRPNIPVNDGPPRRSIPINDGPPGDIPIKDVPSESAPARFVPVAKLQLVMVDFSAVWILFGILSASGVMRVIDQYQSTRSCYRELFHPKCDVCKNFEFYEGLNMKVEQQIPLLLVERQALNEAMEAEKTGHHLAETRGLCLSEEQIVRTILRRPIIGPGNKIIEMVTGPYRLVRKCEVTAILILYGLPRLLTGSILAHEMMHAYLRLKEITSGSGSSITTSSAASSSSSAPPLSKKGAKTDVEKKLGEFFKHQIETDSSVAYGDGFRAGIRAVELYGLRRGGGGGGRCLPERKGRRPAFTREKGEEAGARVIDEEGEEGVPWRRCSEMEDGARALVVDEGEEAVALREDQSTTVSSRIDAAAGGEWPP